MRHSTSERAREVVSRRSQLYQLLAAAHSGPLGQELARVIRVAASSLFEDEPLPDVPTPSRAELYRQVYGLATKNPGAAVTHPLPAKLTHLAWSAGRTAQGRAHEAAYIEEALLPCLGRVLERAEALGASGYAGLLLLTRAVVQADAKHLRQLDLRHGVPPYRSARVKRMKHTSVTEASLEALVHTFYERVRAHETLGPVFNAALAGRWDAHLARMVDFWSSVLLASKRYYGQPLHAHLLVQGLKPEHFGDWLGLFHETLTDLFVPEVAERIFTAASRMGGRIQRVLFQKSPIEGFGGAVQQDSPVSGSRHALGDEPPRWRPALKEPT